MKAVLYSFFLRKGLLNLYSDNCHSRFFKELIEASRTRQGRQAIEKYANSDSNLPPNLPKLNTLNSVEDLEPEIQVASDNELSQFMTLDNGEPLDYSETKETVEILGSYHEQL
jgi:hypothetical protein